MNSKRCHNLTAASCGVLNPTANKLPVKSPLRDAQRDSSAGFLRVGRFTALVGEFFGNCEGFKTKNKVKNCPLRVQFFSFSQFSSGFFGKYFELRIAVLPGPALESL
jgi:hypothetical protein